MLFNSLMIEVFKGTDTGGLIQAMFVHIKMQAENAEFLSVALH